MPLTAKTARLDWRRYVIESTQIGECLQYWKSAGRLPRWVYEGYHKKILPSSIHVCHTCDNPWCINLDHLWEGTAKDNQKDSVNKGRHVGSINFEKAREVAHSNASERAKNQWDPGGSLYWARKK